MKRMKPCPSARAGCAGVKGGESPGLQGALANESWGHPLRRGGAAPILSPSLACAPSDAVA